MGFRGIFGVWGSGESLHGCRLQIWKGIGRGGGGLGGCGLLGAVDSSLGRRIGAAWLAAHSGSALSHPSVFPVVGAYKKGTRRGGVSGWHMLTCAEKHQAGSGMVSWFLDWKKLRHVRVVR